MRSGEGGEAGIFLECLTCKFAVNEAHARARYALNHPFNTDSRPHLDRQEAVDPFCEIAEYELYGHLIKDEVGDAALVAAAQAELLA